MIIFKDLREQARTRLPSYFSKDSNEVFMFSIHAFYICILIFLFRMICAKFDTYKIPLVEKVVENSSKVSCFEQLSFPIHVYVCCYICSVHVDQALKFQYHIQCWELEAKMVKKSQCYSPSNLFKSLKLYLQTILFHDGISCYSKRIESNNSIMYLYLECICCVQLVFKSQVSKCQCHIQCWGLEAKKFDKSHTCLGKSILKLYFKIVLKGILHDVKFYSFENTRSIFSIKNLHLEYICLHLVFMSLISKSYYAHIQYLESEIKMGEKSQSDHLRFLLKLYFPSVGLLKVFVHHNRNISQCHIHFWKSEARIRENSQSYFVRFSLKLFFQTILKMFIKNVKILNLERIESNISIKHIEDFACETTIWITYCLKLFIWTLRVGMTIHHIVHVNEIHVYHVIHVYVREFGYSHFLSCQLCTGLRAWLMNAQTAFVMHSPSEIYKAKYLEARITCDNILYHAYDLSRFKVNQMIYPVTVFYDRLCMDVFIILLSFFDYSYLQVFL